MRKWEQSWAALFLRGNSLSQFRLKGERLCANKIFYNVRFVDDGKDLKIAIISDNLPFVATSFGYDIVEYVE